MNDNNITIILISGYARSGKDTLAKALIEYARTKESARVSFATPLKRAVQLALNELGLGHIDAFTEDPKLKALLRPLFVEVGKAARAIDKDVFVKAAWKDICDLGSNGKELLVVPDLRYSNEIELFRKWGEGVGDTVKHIHISRSGNESANQEEYESVKALPSPDVGVMFMDGATSDIAQWADKYMTQLWVKGIFKDKKIAVAYDEKASVWTDIKTEQSSDSPFVTVTSCVSTGKSAILDHIVSGTERFGAEEIEKRNAQRVEDMKAMNAVLEEASMLVNVSNRVEWLEDKVDRLQQIIGKMGERVDTDRANLAGHEQDIGKMGERLKDLGGDIGSMEDTVERLSARVTGTDNMVLHVKMLLERIDARLKRLEVARG